MLENIFYFLDWMTEKWYHFLFSMLALIGLVVVLALIWGLIIDIYDHFTEPENIPSYMRSYDKNNNRKK